MAIVKVTPERIARAMRETDWCRVDAQTERDIARAVASDPDAAPILTDSETVAAMVRTVRKQLNLSHTSRPKC